nr:P-II family nitrogen regulator [Pseudonocardia acidicola]
MVSAVIAPERFAAVREALRTFADLGLTVTEVFERDRSGRHEEVYRGRHVQVDVSPGVRMEIVAPDGDAADLVHIIARVAAGQPGDGRVWVCPVEAMVRVRTGERGVDAL